jgi:lipid II:glycine glycyltransferase (peptidoglycan interpeptide bridge formation enzyme)
MLQGQLRCDSMEIRSFNTLPMFDNELLSPQSLYKHHYIELDAEPDQLKNRFHRTCVRQRINRAVQSKLNLVKGTNEQSLRDFYKLYMLSRKRLALPPQPYAFIKSMWETFSPSGKIALLMAELNGQIIAGMILFKYKERVSAEYAVMDDSFYNVSPNHFLFWEAIKSASGEGYKLFDFGRTDPGNTNLMEFKSRWGTKVADIRHFEYPGIRNKSENKERTFAYNLVKNICSRSPDAVFQLIGKLCYRHMS